MQSENCFPALSRTRWHQNCGTRRRTNCSYPWQLICGKFMNWANPIFFFKMDVQKLQEATNKLKEDFMVFLNLSNQNNLFILGIETSFWPFHCQWKSNEAVQPDTENALFVYTCARFCRKERILGAFLWSGHRKSASQIQFFGYF